MLCLLADENFNNRILRALIRRVPKIDVIRVQDTHLSGAADPDVLEWASDEGRVVLTHDISTMIGYARERVISGKSMPGLIAVRTNRPIGLVIEDIEIVLLASESEEIDKRVLFIPL